MNLRLVKVRQKIPAAQVQNPAQELNRQLARFKKKVGAGQSVAIACGSRGIGQTSEMVKILVDWVKSQKAEPFIVPAMGSHGASTSEGQKKVLAELGISEELMGCPVRSEIEAEKVGELKRVSVYTDLFAARADHIVLVNRIKPHTSFHSRYESGLCKMLAVGLGKRKGAEEIHKFGPAVLAGLIPEAARFLLKKLPVLFGVALLENGRGKIAGIKVIAAKDFLQAEPGLLKQAYKLLPGIPFKELDVLIVDQIGKDKSGTGMDTNVIGRLDLRGMPEPKQPRIRRIVVLGLSDKSGDSAYGIGLADITTRKVVEQMDLKAMRENALASALVERARIPLWFNSDREAIEAAVRSCWQPDWSELRLCRIKSTLELEEFWITENLLARSEKELKVISPGTELRFDADGNIL